MENTAPVSVRCFKGSITIASKQQIKVLTSSETLKYYYLCFTVTNNNFPEVTIHEFLCSTQVRTQRRGILSSLQRNKDMFSGSGLSLPLPLLFMSGLHESVLCNPGTSTAHRSSWLNIPALCDLDSVSFAFPCPSFFWKERRMYQWEGDNAMPSQVPDCGQ